MTTELHNLRDELNTWRGKCRAPGRLPSVLKQKILLLMKRYSWETLTKELPLKASTLKRWQQQPRPRHPAASFIPLPPSRSSLPVGAIPPAKQAASDGMTLSVELINGISLRFSGQSRQELLEFTCALAKGLGA